VVTVGALVTWLRIWKRAALVLDFAGFAKGSIRPYRHAQADVLLACDMVVGVA
jgi:hypothetical protein